MSRYSSSLHTVRTRPLEMREVKRNVPHADWLGVHFKKEFLGTPVAADVCLGAAPDWSSPRGASDPPPFVAEVPASLTFCRPP